MNVTHPSLALAQLRWACRRGMLELDLIFERYCEYSFQQATSQEQHLFESLLHCQDQDLYDWLVVGHAPPSEFATIIRILRDEA